MADDKGATIVVFSGDMDKVMAAFNIAIGAAASGKDTTMFFTFWGMKAIQKGTFTGDSFFGRMMGLMNRGGINRIGPSRFNFGGVGRWMFKKLMKDHNITPIHELRDLAIELGVRMIPCQMSMEVMEIKKEHLIDGIEETAGVAAMLEAGDRSRTTLFI